jgi:hypothetical protein
MRYIVKNSTRNEGRREAARLMAEMTEARRELKAERRKMQQSAA